MDIVPQQKEDSAYPEVLAGQRIQCEATGSLGEYRHVQSDVSLENQSVCLPFGSGWYAEMQCSGNIRCSIIKLCARIAEIDGIRIDHRAGAPFGLVVDDGATVSMLAYRGKSTLPQRNSLWPGGRNGIERKANEVSLFASELFQLVGGLHLVDLGPFFNKLVLKPGKVLD